MEHMLSSQALAQAPLLVFLYLALGAGKAMPWEGTFWLARAACAGSSPPAAGDGSSLARIELSLVPRLWLLITHLGLAKL